MIIIRVRAGEFIVCSYTTEPISRAPIRNSELNSHDP